MKGKLFVVSGPSGVGKGTICKRVREMDDKIAISVSATTRKPREEDKEGVTYYFLTNEQFDVMIGNNEFYEWANVHDNRYGTPKKPVEEKINEGIDVILEIDVQGGMLIKSQVKDAVMVFIAPPSMEVLEERLRGRHSETEEQIQKRLKNALVELEHEKDYDHIIVNDDLETAVKALYELILNERNS